MSEHISAMYEGRKRVHPSGFPAWDVYGDKDRVIARMMLVDGIDATERRTHLFAAAPDLLAACEAAYAHERGGAYDNAYRANSFHKPDDDQLTAWLSPLGKQLRAAIAKAKG